jgi:hypothetical protein
MTRGRNIFYKLTKENEDSTSDLFCNLLRSKFIRYICLKYFEIPEIIIENIKIENITTRKKTNEGIPDIFIKNNECFYIIENKIKLDTVLQENQKSSYMDFFKELGMNNFGYIFIVPENYKHESEILDLIKKNYFIKIFYWEKFLKYLLDFEIQNEAPIINESLNYLIEIILNKTSLYNEDIFLTPYEVAMLYSPKDVFESLNLCNKIFLKIKSLESDILGGIYNISPDDEYFEIKNPDFIGKHFRYKDNDSSFCIGLNLKLMRDNVKDILDNTKKPSEYFFSISFNKKYLKSEFYISNEHFKDMDHFDDVEWIYIPLNRKHLLEDDNGELIKSDIVEIVRKVIDNNIWHTTE